MHKPTVEQLCELHRQIGSGETNRDNLQAFLTHRTPAEAAAARDLREVQARVLFEKIGDALGCATFNQYLNGTDELEPIPQIPMFPKEQVRLFGAQGIVLVDGRVFEKVGLTEYCKLVGLAYGGVSDTCEPYDAKRAKYGVRWMISQDGFRNRHRSVQNCRETFASFEVGMDSVEGIATWLQDPSVIKGHYLYLPGSVHRGVREGIAHLGVTDHGPGFCWYWGGYAPPGCGSASRGE